MKRNLYSPSYTKETSRLGNFFQNFIFFLFALDLLISTLLFFYSPPVLDDEESGVFSGPGSAVITAKQAAKLSDDTYASLCGIIIQNIENEEYLFRDDTGTITVEIDDDLWQGQSTGPEDFVEISGEVEKEWLRVEMDVDRVTKQ